MRTLEEKAKELVYSLGIALYIRDGRLFQHPPGERIDPGEGAHPDTFGRGEVAVLGATV